MCIMPMAMCVCVCVSLSLSRTKFFTGLEQLQYRTHALVESIRHVAQWMIFETSNFDHRRGIPPHVTYSLSKLAEV